ncbi:MAG: hypothetical protein ABJA75_24975 [Bradyrhizobium sp.]
MKYVLAAAALLLVALGVVFFFGPNPDPVPTDPKVKQLSDLAGLAERMCLSSTSNAQSAAIKLKLELISKQIAGDGSVTRGREALRGAADSLAETVKKTENDDVRKCMEPWSEKIRDLAKTLG